MVDFFYAKKVVQFLKKMKFFEMKVIKEDL